MEFISMKDAASQEIVLKNSKSQEVTVNLAEVIKEVNEKGYDLDYFPTQLSFKGEEGDWMEVLKIPTYNGQEDENGNLYFCLPQWQQNEEGLYSSDVSVDRMFWYDGAWQYPINYMPENVRKEVNGNWEAFRVPVF